MAAENTDRTIRGLGMEAARAARFVSSTSAPW